MKEMDLKKENNELKLQHINDQQEIKTLKTERRNAERYAERLKQKMDRESTNFKKKFDAMSKKYKKLGKKYQDAIKINKKYDNANTPPSLRGTNTKMDRRVPPRSDEKPRKQGGQPGHPGTTDSAKPSKIVRHHIKECPDCKSKNLKLLKKSKRTTTEITKPAVVEKIRHDLYKYKCEECGKNVESDADLPKKGKFGKNIMVQVLLAFLERLPYRLIMRRLARMGIDMAFSTVYEILKNIGFSLHDASQNILNNIRKARTLHVDETSMRLHGENVWMWIFLDPDTSNVYYVIRDSRGSKVPKSVLKGWNGTLVCDGWSAYFSFDVQRCWAHILREARAINYKHHSPATKEVEDELYAIFHDGEDAKGNLQDREKLVKRLQKKSLKLAERHGEKPTLKVFLRKLTNAVPDLFRYVIDPGIPPTNNAAERGLREPIVQRKIRGTMKAEDSMEWMGNIYTCVQTWMAQSSEVAENIAKHV